MDIFSVLTMVGGLALFLYGMQVMGDGLAKVSGGKLERILENLTSSPIKAVLLGAATRVPYHKRGLRNPPAPTKKSSRGCERKASFFSCA